MNKLSFNVFLIGGAALIGLYGNAHDWSWTKLLIIAGIWGLVCRPLVAFFKGLLG